MTYVHGNWYCKPSNEAEAKEIVERAIASGAMVDERPGDAKNHLHFSWNFCDAWGVLNGRTYTGDIGHYFENCPEYTLTELRQKFLLPDEHVEEPKQWRGSKDGLPPVGTVCIGEHEDVNNGNPCTVEILKHNKNGIGCVVFWIDAPNGKGNLFWCSRFFPLRTERDKWVEAATKMWNEHPDSSAKSFSEVIYDAIQSGQLKTPGMEG